MTNNTSTRAPGVYTCQENIHGIAYADWTAKFWKWVHSIPKDKNPSEDNNCETCGQYQEKHSKVWFLTGAQSRHPMHRRCTVEVGRDILFPVINEDCYYPHAESELRHTHRAGIALHTESQLVNFVREQINQVTKKEVTIDGRKLDDSKICRVLSTYEVTFAAHGVYGNTKAISTRGASDGYWVFLNDIPKKDFDIHFMAEAPDFGNDVTYHVKVA